MDERNISSVQTIQSQPAAEGVASSQDVTDEETKRLDGRHWSCASPFHLPCASNLVVADQFAADQLIEQLYVAQSGETVKLWLISLLHDRDQSQKKAEALRAKGQALLEQAKATERVGRAIESAYHCLVGVAITQQVNSATLAADH